MNTAVGNNNVVSPWAATWATDDNGATIQEHCKKIFIGKFESMFIAKAVQEKMRVGDPALAESTHKVRSLSTSSAEL